MSGVNMLASISIAVSGKIPPKDKDPDQQGQKNANDWDNI